MVKYKLTLRIEQHGKTYERSFTCPTERLADERQLEQLMSLAESDGKLVEAELVRQRAR